MVGYAPLDSLDYELLLKTSIKKLNVENDLLISQTSEITRKLDENLNLRLNLAGYDNIKYYKANNDLIVITTELPAYKCNAIISQLRENYPSQAFLMGVRGHGATETHVATVYVSAATDNPSTVKIIDSKVSDAEKFFKQFRDKSLLGEPFILLVSLLRSILPNPKQEIEITLNNETRVKAEYISLGTQSFFDPASCGYHSAATIKICEDLLIGGQKLTREAILDNTRNPVSEGSEIILKHGNAGKVKTSYVDFLKQAWEDDPILLLPLNLGAETGNYLRNKLINWAPTSTSSQYLRSGLMLLTAGLEHLFKIGRVIALPFTTIQAAMRTFDAPKTEKQGDPLEENWEITAEQQDDSEKNGDGIPSSNVEKILRSGDHLEPKKNNNKVHVPTQETFQYSELIERDETIARIKDKKSRTDEEEQRKIELKPGLIVDLN